MSEQTLLLIKPNAVAKKKIGAIINTVEENDFEIKDIRMCRFDKEFASLFYEEHKNKHFFNRLINFMTSGRTVSVILEKENAIEELRNLAGNTVPQEAETGTIRKLYGTDVTENAVHASDSADTAQREIELIRRMILATPK